MIDNLIYGKNDTKYITSIEIKDDVAELFIEEPGKPIRSEFTTNKFWILADRLYGKGWIKLKGNQFYKYGKQFSTNRQFQEEKRKYKDVYKVNDSKESFMINKGFGYFKGLTPRDVSILSFDIESTTLDLNDDAKLLLISNTFRDSSGKCTKKLFAYDDYENEGKMLENWCAWVREMNPTILAGHNLYGHDLPYMQYIADRYNVKLILGRDGSPIRFNSYESKFRKDQTQDFHYNKCYIYGREILDTLFLVIKIDVITKKYDNYGLKSIIATEELEKEDREFYDASQIRFKYKIPEEWIKIKKYAIDDADDVLALYDRLVPSTFYWAQSVPKSFQEVVCSATGSQLNSMMVRSYLQEGHSIAKASEGYKFEGGLSYGIPGIYDNCFKIDLKSAYPHAIIQYELYDKQKDPEANFLKIVTYFTEQRIKDKEMGIKTGDQYFINLSESRKVAINSAYGLTSTNGLNYNCFPIAERITAITRDCLRKSIMWATSRESAYWESLVPE